ncbi:hypothetical protein [Arthrobacter koreensis]|uniref:hypothetical protein n=1 Tax=Arthrobacter koreensis TaxID=199136 RepID=UPI0038269BB9
MIISATTYNAKGELMAPLPSDLATKHPELGGKPTMEPGFYHRFKFEAPDAAGLHVKEKRFFELMAAVPGFSSLKLRPYQVRVGSLHRTGLDIVYVIERAGAR